MGTNLRARVAQRAAGDSTVTEIAQRQKPLADLVREMEPEFAKAAPKGVEAVQVVRDVLSAISVNPKLRECEPLTVLGGAMTMAQLGLRVNVLGHGWLIPFWDKHSRGMKAQLVIGYKGLAELVGRSGMVSDLGAHAVHRADEFRMAFVEGRRVLNHDPDWWGDRGELLGWFAAGKVTGFDTYTFTEPWSVARMEAHRDRFAMAKKDGQVVGPWRDHFESMAKKTVLLDLIKLLPKSTDVVRAIEADGSVRVDLAPDGIDRGEPVTDGEVVADTFEEDPPAGDDSRATATAVPAAAKATEKQLQRIVLLLSDLGVESDDGQRQALSERVGRNLDSRKDLTRVEAARIIADLEMLGPPADGGEQQ